MKIILLSNLKSKFHFFFCNFVQRRKVLSFQHEWQTQTRSWQTAYFCLQCSASTMCQLLASALLTLDAFFSFFHTNLDWARSGLAAAYISGKNELQKKKSFHARVFPIFFFETLLPFTVSFLKLNFFAETETLGKIEKQRLFGFLCIFLQAYKLTSIVANVLKKKKNGLRAE